MRPRSSVAETHDAPDQALNPARLRPAKQLVLAVDVVHDLAEGAQRGITHVEALDQRLKRAVFADVRVRRRRSCRSEARQGAALPARRHEFESRLGIDEASDQPRARDAVDVYVGARHPRASGRTLSGAAGLTAGDVPRPLSG